MKKDTFEIEETISNSCSGCVIYEKHRRTSCRLISKDFKRECTNFPYFIYLNVPSSTLNNAIIMTKLNHNVLI